MKIKDLAPNPNNPRIISDEKRAMLKRALAEFGDLSGVIYNKKTKQLVGGHQRVSAFENSDADIMITKRYPKPTKSGTTLEGYAEINGERFAFREVSWTPTKEKAANIAANKSAGEWDKDTLGEWLSELGNFDLDFDVSLTMFDEDEIKKLLPTTRTPKQKDEAEEVGSSRIHHECPNCGHEWSNSKK